jgi:hypothetical protein
MEMNPKQQRQHFYRDYTSGQWSMTNGGQPKCCATWSSGEATSA